jgi:hypothetical protein
LIIPFFDLLLLPNNFLQLVTACRPRFSCFCLEALFFNNFCLKTQLARTRFCLKKIPFSNLFLLEKKTFLQLVSAGRHLSSIWFYLPTFLQRFFPNLNQS